MVMHGDIWGRDKEAIVRCHYGWCFGESWVWVCLGIWDLALGFGARIIYYDSGGFLFPSLEERAGTPVVCGMNCVFGSSVPLIFLHGGEYHASTFGIEMENWNIQNQVLD